MMKKSSFQELQNKIEQLHQEQAVLQEALRKCRSEVVKTLEERDRSQGLIELAADAIFTGDPKGNFTGVNQSALALTGYSRDELLTMHMGQLFSKEEQLRVPLRYDLLKQGKVVQTERTLTRKDGSVVPIEMNSKMMPDGTLHAFIRDVTRRKVMEQDLLESEAHQRALSEATFEAVVLTRKGVCIGQNDNTEKMFGYSPEELEGKYSTILIAPEERENVRENMDSGYEQAYETMGLTKDGRRFPVEICGREINYRGEQVRVAAIRDISAQKRAEQDSQVIQKLESIGTLAGGIAHDFNNILTGLFGNLSLAKIKLENTHPAFRHIEQAENSLNRATHLTGKLLTFAKGGDPIIEQVSLVDLVRETVSFDLSGSNIRLVLSADDDLWQAEVDKGQIQQVFSNLAINAKQAMVDGGHLSIRFSNYQHGADNLLFGRTAGKYIRAEVRDEGIGISEKHLGRVFDPYFSTKQTGRGLGLASVFSIIARHKGKISVSSELGKGTTFTMYLPASSHPVEPIAQGQAEPVGPLGFQPRVLVMDDDEDILHVVEEMLVAMDCQVVTAVNGFRAVELYRKAVDDGRCFDLVILDLTVPGGGGGKETVQHLLEIDPKARVVVSSGYTEDPVMAHYADYGFRAVVSKPYIFNHLQQVVFRVLHDSP